MHKKATGGDGVERAFLTIGAWKVKGTGRSYTRGVEVIFKFCKPHCHPGLQNPMQIPHAAAVQNVPGGGHSQ